MNSSTKSALPGHTPARIASSPLIHDVKISPNGKYVLYHVQPLYKSGERTMSELWISRADEERGTRRLTSGMYNDKMGAFHPDGERVIFLSDRHNPGRGAHLYSLTYLDEDDEEPPQPLVSNPTKHGVKEFEISPDGDWIAYTSVVNNTEVDCLKLKNKDDAKVYGTPTEVARLRILQLRTGDSFSVEGVPKDAVIESFSWSPDGKEVIYRSRQDQGCDAPRVTLQKVSINGKKRKPTEIHVYSRSLQGRSIWFPSGHVAELQSYHPRGRLDADAVFIHPPGQSSLPLDDVDRSTRFYGEVDDAISLASLDPGESKLAIEIASDMDTRIDTLSLVPEEPPQNPRTLLSIHHDQAVLHAKQWDAKRIVEGDGQVAYIIAAVLSSGVRNEPPNVWTIKIAENDDGGDSRSPTKMQLSAHVKWLSDAPKMRMEFMEWETQDGVKLTGIVRYPAGYDESWGPLPTILHIHDGPYGRSLPDSTPEFSNWRDLLASAGYLVISPNYRGSQGRGHRFANSANSGIGVFDWPDCLSMVDEAIKRGLTDPESIGVAGWGYGGSLTAWGVTQTKDRFKAAIIGAGVTNWETVMDSGATELPTALGWTAPWCKKEEEQQPRFNPIREADGVDTVVLVLHGEADEEIPVNQAIGFWRGLKVKASKRGQQAQLVVYPREGHRLTERKHVEDLLGRVVNHFKTWI